jgi:hypothetical protein
MRIEEHRQVDKQTSPHLQRNGVGKGQEMTDVLSWVLSGTSGLMLWLMGNKSKWGPRVGLANQILWAIYAVALKQWGLLPGVVLYAVIHVRNTIRWEKQNVGLN